MDPNARANSRRFRTEREQDRLHELAMAMVKEELAEPDASQQAMEFLRSRGHTGASATALWRDAQASPPLCVERRAGGSMVRIIS